MVVPEGVLRTDPVGLEPKTNSRTNVKAAAGVFAGIKWPVPLKRT